MSSITPRFQNTILAAVGAAYQAAGLEASAMTSAVVPLQRLIAAQPLVVSEVAQLTHQRAATYLAAHAGRPIIEGKNASEPLAGFLYANAAGGWILVEQRDPIARRRFTVAHELGHYLLHFLPRLEQTLTLHGEDLVDFNEELPAPLDLQSDPAAGRVTLDYLLDEASSPDELIRWEFEANRFAAELLMPEELCRSMAHQYESRYGRKRQVLARRLTTEFLVSQAAMLRRLDELQIA